MKKISFLLLTLLIVWSCKNDEGMPTVIEEEPTPTPFVSAVDVSSWPEIRTTNPTFYNSQGNSQQFLTILKDKGVNTIRLRLWVNPSNVHSGFQEVKQFSQTLTAYGFDIWLALHYSDTWADPGQQATPANWEGNGFVAVKDSVYQYTKKVVTEINPAYIQIGNEINSGFLHPYGNISTNRNQFLELLSTGASAVRDHSEEAKIMIQFAGIDGADWFFNQVQSIDYDMIGLSYYPIWHGKSLENLKSTMTSLSQTHNKEILIAETAYPFTLGWNDFTHNIVGLEEQLILPEYPASPQGQKDFLEAVKTVTQEVEKGVGFSYWGGELIAWKGSQATDASPWENQALFDFENQALPVLDVFE